MPHVTSEDPGAALTAAPPPDTAFAQVRAVADAVLYEGYLLYPYRGSAAKNRLRWQFGLLAPRAWIEADGPVAPVVAGSAESWFQQTECVAEAGPGAVLRLRLRYLQVQHRRVERRDAGGAFVAVDALETADGSVARPFDEAVAREHDVAVPLADLLAAERAFPVCAPAGEETEDLPGGTGRLVRTRRPVRARLTVSAERLDTAVPACRLQVRTENTADSVVGPGAPREQALQHALIATHTLLGGDGITFVSLTDPPEWAQEPVRACRNLHTFPVLAGEPGSRTAMLSSPIILSDHPQVAPESPGDLHDAAEIDEILSLRTLLLTDEEKREARATDRRAAQILDRVDDMPPEVFARLHGTIRSLRPASAGPPPRTDAEEQES